MNKKRYHLFVPDYMRYEAYDYEDSFVELDDAFQVFVAERPTDHGFIMQNSDDGGLVRTHEFSAEHYWDKDEHAYHYKIVVLIKAEAETVE